MTLIDCKNVVVGQSVCNGIIGEASSIPTRYSPSGRKPYPPVPGCDHALDLIGGKPIGGSKIGELLSIPARNAKIDCGKPDVALRINRCVPHRIVNETIARGVIDEVSAVPTRNAT